jgi:hypothetical protein
MCPACLRTTALLFAGATATGGGAVVLPKKPNRRKTGIKVASLISTNSQKEKCHE